MITSGREIPKSSILNSNGDSFDYIDSFKGIATTKEQRVDKTLFLELFLNSGPEWADHLLSLRDRAVKFFGLKTSDMSINDQTQLGKELEIGSQVGMFKLFDISDSEYILGEDDKHLNVRVSLLVEPLEDNPNRIGLSITTAVKFNNVFGRLYFIPVKPIHRLIVRSSLKEIIQRIGRASLTD